jgi:tetratricopeptide (TPR) repeat protein
MKNEEKAMVKTMDYGDRQYFIVLRGIVENKEDGWEDCAKELRESFEAAQKAADEGDAAGQYNLAMHYDYDFGVEGTEEEAFKWYEKAAVQGHSDAMHSIAWCYKRGCGTSPDSEKYFEWQKKAAFAYYAEGQIDSAVHAVDCLADNSPDTEVIALFSQMRNDSRVQEYAAKRYPSTPAFLDDLERRLKFEYLKHNDDVKYETSVNYTIHGQFSIGELALRAHERLFDWDMYVYRLPYSPRWLPAHEDPLTCGILENHFPLKAGDTGPAGGLIIKCDKTLCIADNTGEHGYHCVEAAPFDAGYASWQDAFRICEEYSLNGIDGWRLPTVNELREFAATLRTRLREQSVQQTTETVINWSSVRSGETATTVVTQENEDFYQYLYHYPMGGTSGGFYRSKDGPRRGETQEFPVTHLFAVRPVRDFYAKNIVRAQQ